MIGGPWDGMGFNLEGRQSHGSGGEVEYGRSPVCQDNPNGLRVWLVSHYSFRVVIGWGWRANGGKGGRIKGDKERASRGHAF